MEGGTPEEKEDNEIMNESNHNEKKNNINIKNNKDIKNKNFVKKLDLGKLNLEEIIIEKKLQNINENSLEDKENESINKKKSDEFGLDDFSMGMGDMEQEEENDEENEELEDDFDEIWNN